MTPRAAAAVASLVVAALASGCAGPGPGASGSGGGSPDVSSAPPRTAAASPVASSRSVEEADLVGTLGGDAQLEGGCVWVRTDEGESYEILYPEGWRVQADPVALRNPQGDVVATEGDRIGLIGGEAAGVASICQIGPIFRATEVILED